MDTLNSDIVFCKPDLSRKSSPTTQIGLLAAQPTANHGSQTKQTPVENTPVKVNQHHLLHMLCLDFHSTLEDPQPTTSTNTAITAVQCAQSESTMETTSVPTLNVDTEEADTSVEVTLEQMRSRKPACPSLFVPPQKKPKIGSHLLKIWKDC